MRRSVVLATALLLALPACVGDKSESGGADTLKGLLKVATGECAGATPSGSWFKMVQPGGTVDAGPYVVNQDSTCADKAITALEAGTEGGLEVGSYQEQADPPFGPDGSSNSVGIIKPQRFFAIGFGASTNEVDPQTKLEVPAPTVTVDGGKLTGDVSALDIAWNGQHFNQGAPKPDKSGKKATGTYDADSGEYSLEWASAIDGGPFDGFTGFWHLAGEFEEDK